MASILRSNLEGELNCAMSALYSKSFIFGSYEREISCASNQTQDDGDVDGSEHLVVKTKSFARTSVLGRNEQWCYFDYFRRKTERDGFTITKRALPASEPIPGRITEKPAHVEQLHGLNTSYLVDKPADRKECSARGLSRPKTKEISLVVVEAIAPAPVQAQDHRRVVEILGSTKFNCVGC